MRISDWGEFQDYFGGTSTEKFKGNNTPKYELPYIAKSYLQQSKQLEVCRVLGFSGYNAGSAWAIYGEKGEVKDGKFVGDGNKYLIAILRSKGEYGKVDAVPGNCSGSSDNDKMAWAVKSVTAE